MNEIARGARWVGVMTSRLGPARIVSLRLFLSLPLKLVVPIFVPGGGHPTRLAVVVVAFAPVLGRVRREAPSGGLVPVPA